MSTKLLTLGTALLLSAPAMARPAHGHGNHGHGHAHERDRRPDTSIFVDNQWAAPVNVQIDGRFVGTLTDNGEDLFRVRPGFHTVRVLAMNGTVLESADQWLRPHQRAFVAVDTPMTTLTVSNTGTTPLFVSGARAGLWVEPGRTRTATVPAGKLFLTASVAGRHGELRRVDDQSLWAEPGRRNRTTFDFTPTPTRLLVRNNEPSTVRLFVDGQAFGTLASGASLALDVRPGRHEIDAWGRHGRVVFDGTVLAGRGVDTRVDLFNPRPPSRPTTYASASHDRPSHRRR